MAVDGFFVTDQGGCVSGFICIGRQDIQRRDDLAVRIKGHIQQIAGEVGTVHATPSVCVLDTHHPIAAVWIVPIGKQLVRQR